MADDKSDLAAWAKTYMEAADAGEKALAKTLRGELEAAPSEEVATALIVEANRGKIEDVAALVVLTALGYGSGMLAQTYIPHRFYGRLGTAPTAIGAALIGYGLFGKKTFKDRVWLAGAGVGVGLGGACITFPRPAESDE